MPLQALKRAIKQVGPVYRAINRLKRSRIHDPNRRADSVVLGTDYGGWAIIPSLLRKDSVVYSFGVGEDISFDLALVDMVGCTVNAFDPTPIAVEWMASQKVPPELQFHQLGISSVDTEVAFQVPPIPGWHSYSLQAEKDAQQTGTVMCRVARVQTIMAQLGHKHLDVLKMDVEGFEYPVIEDMLAARIYPRQLLVEFHHGYYGHTVAQTKESVARLRAAGYDLFWVSDVGREYGFLRRDV